MLPRSESRLRLKTPAACQASETFAVKTPASAPIVASQTPTQTWKLDQNVNFTLAANTFSDPQGEALTYTATRANGAPLPSWLSFNAANQTFSGTVPNRAAGLRIKVRAKDTSGLSRSETFAVQTPASAPIVASQTPTQTWKLDQNINFTLAANTFGDPQGEALTFTATLANGAPLPSWLTFNAAKKDFRGTVPNSTTGLSIKVTAKDTSGLSTSETFAVQTPASAPIVASQTPTQTWKLDQNVNFTLAANTFSDPQGEALTYTATLANGAPLPSWLTFNAANKNFSGTVPNSAAGLSIDVTATDSSGLSASEIFSVSTPASAPIVASQTATQTWNLGQNVDFTLAANTFADPQAEALTYTATLANGAPLPSWLTFNAANQTFSGTVPNSAAGLSIDVTATDSSGLSTSEIFSVSTPASAPIVASQTATQTWNLGQNVDFTLAASTFADPQGEALTYTATLANGAPLPSWLTFNAANQTFSGTVPNSAAGLEHRCSGDRQQRPLGI